MEDDYSEHNKKEIDCTLVVLNHMTCMEIFTEEFKKEIDNAARCWKILLVQ